MCVRKINSPHISIVKLDVKYSKIIKESQNFKGGLNIMVRKNKNLWNINPRLLCIEKLKKISSIFDLNQSI